MRILIIRPGAIGDSLLTFPVLEALRTRHPGAELFLVGNAAVLPLARALGVADVVANYEDMQWSALFGHVSEATPLHALLRATDMAVCWLRDAEGVVERNLRACGVRQVIIAPGRPEERMHIVEYLARCVDVQIEQPPCYRKRLGVVARRQVERRCLALHPGSGGARKCWPLTHFAATIRALWQRDICVSLLSGPADHERLNWLQRQLPSPPHASLLRVLNAVPLLELARQLCQCDGYLGNDSGITHLAAQLGLPTLALFGPSDPVTWRPLGCSVSVLHAPELGNLAVDVVMSKLESFLV